MSRTIEELENEVGMMGELESWPLCALLTWLHQAGHTAVVYVGTGLLRGEIYLKDGELVSCRWGECSGEVALGALLTLRRGVFRVARTTELDVPQNIHGGTEEVILRWAVRLDEYRWRAAAA